MSDALLEEIAEYVCNPPVFSKKAWDTAHLCFTDSIACALLAHKAPACQHLIGPIVPEAICTTGSRVIGTKYHLDPIQAAFNNGLLIRWLDYNDTWLAKEWGHPSDNLGGILSITNWIPEITIKDVLQSMILAYEIQGVLALENSMNSIGFDHVFFVKIATTAVAMKLLRGDKNDVVNAISQAFIDTGPLRTYRHAPSTGPRKSWAAGDATSRGVFLALLTKRGEPGYSKALSSPKWGFNDVLLSGKEWNLSRSLSDYVMENILFKVAFPAEFHAQTAVEAAFALHKKHKKKIDKIQSIEIATQEAAIRIIDKTGPLHNPADRDHCLQYMVAVGLLKGNLEANDYEEGSREIDSLREKMHVVEDSNFSKDYLDPNKRSIGNRVTISFEDGTKDSAQVEYPIGHKRRRKEAEPLLYKKFEGAVMGHFKGARAEGILEMFTEKKALEELSVRDFMECLSIETF